MEVVVWKLETMVTSIVRGKCVEKPHTEYCSEDQAVRLWDSDLSWESELIRTKIVAWVSDHFGIAVERDRNGRIRVEGERMC